MNNLIDKDLRDIEAQLASLSPNKMPDDIIKRMEQAMIAWETHLPVEEKIVPFQNVIDKPTASPAKKINLNIWGAAAAIVLAAGLTTVFNSHDSVSTKAAAAEPKSSPVTASALVTDDNVAKLSRNIIHASNEGITYAGKDDAPFKVLRIEYTEEVTTQDKDGNPLISKKPCVEHVLVPVPVH